MKVLPQFFQIYENRLKFQFSATKNCTWKFRARSENSKFFFIQRSTNLFNTKSGFTSTYWSSVVTSAIYS